MVGPCCISCCISFLSQKVCFATRQTSTHCWFFQGNCCHRKGGHYNQSVCFDPFVTQCGNLGWDQLIDVFYFLPGDMQYAILHAGWFFVSEKFMMIPCFLIGVQHILLCWQVDCFPLLFWHWNDEYMDVKDISKFLNDYWKIY